MSQIEDDIHTVQSFVNAVGTQEVGDAVARIVTRLGMLQGTVEGLYLAAPMKDEVDLAAFVKWADKVIAITGRLLHDDGDIAEKLIAGEDPL